MGGDAPLYQEMDNDERQNEWQDDWDNDPEDSFRQPEVTHNGQVDEGPEGTQRSLSPGQQSGSIAGRHGTVKKNINRFSPFVKSGTEAFILGSSSVKRDIRPHEKISIIKSEDDVPVWEPNPTPFEVKVLNPKKQSKFRGIKTFIAYEVVRSDTGQAVSRRYKHYDWLHDRLVNKFTFLSVPPLPDKQFYGRYGEEFVEKRREKLQMWTNRIARHPILSRSDVFHHFLTCPESDEREWKAGKRKAEKDEVCGANLYLCLEPQVVPEVSENEKKVEHFGHFMVDMEENCLKLKAKLIDHCNKMSGPFMAEQHRMAAAIAGLGQSFRREDQPYSNPLSEAINFTAETYREIGEMYSGQVSYESYELYNS
jgi:sorting nexin-9/18/33